ncbi:hypothetical protein [Shouchella tritolerans]|uniref:hypothetical protein n=1 Tax=Shouchella tritolerans TaxID=2979466 RepID=UPI0021E6EC89|nr:hypothetical protein [Shouchella tritolerans]
MAALRLSFGDILINHSASERNPIRKSVFVRRTHKGIMCTDMKGNFWDIQNSAVDDGRIEKVGSVIASKATTV